MALILNSVEFMSKDPTQEVFLIAKRNSGSRLKFLTALLDACIIFKDPIYWESYKNVHRFVFDKMINKGVGEWYPLMTREGDS